MEQALAIDLAPRQRRLPMVSLVVVRVLTDFGAAGAALGLAYWLRFNVVWLPVPGGVAPSVEAYLQAAPVLAGSLVIVFAVTGNYSSSHTSIFVDEMFGLLQALGLVAIVVLAAMTLYATDHFSYSRLTFAYWLVASGLMISFSRYVIRKFERRRLARGIGSLRSLVVGNSRAATQLAQRITMFPDFGYELVGVLTRDGAGEESRGGRVIGRIQSLADIVESHGVDVVFVALPPAEQDQILQLIAANRRPNVEFRVVPTSLEMIASHVEPDQLAGIPLMRIGSGPYSSRARRISKRAFDVVVAGTALFLLAPAMGLIAFLIRCTSRGPVLISQERVGMDHRTFRMLKFRSMRVDAESTSGPVWTNARDVRRTVLGRFLRRFSLDELPQLWNVLKGEMSLVGPRPERPVFVKDFAERIATYGDRHRVRPGITGWAQVNDLRGMTSVDERLVYDLYYIERWSLSFDLKIVMTTAFRVFTSKNAY